MFFSRYVVGDVSSVAGLSIFSYQKNLYCSSTGDAEGGSGCATQPGTSETSSSLPASMGPSSAQSSSSSADQVIYRINIILCGESRNNPWKRDAERRELNGRCVTRRVRQFPSRGLVPRHRSTRTAPLTSVGANTAGRGILSVSRYIKKKTSFIRPKRNRRWVKERVSG